AQVALADREVQPAAQRAIRHDAEDGCDDEEDCQQNGARDQVRVVAAGQPVLRSGMQTTAVPGTRSGPRGAPTFELSGIQAVGLTAAPSANSMTRSSSAEIVMGPIPPGTGAKASRWPTPSEA